MPKKCIQFIEGFLIPSLNEEKFGERLKWINKRERRFQIVWLHKGGPGWTEQEVEVFVEWDKQKGHFQPNESGYFTQSKQRFRSLLYKLTKDGLLILEKHEKNKRTYILGKKKQRRCRNSSKSDVEVEASLAGDDESYDIHFEEDNVNVLEDHTYSTYSNSPQNISADYRYEEMDESNIERRVLRERNILDDDNADFIENNINLAEVRQDFFLGQNEDIPKISENGFDVISADQYRFSEDFDGMSRIPPNFSQLPVTNHALEWSSNLNVNSVLFLFNEVAK